METTKAVPQKASYRGVFFAVALLGVYSLPAAASSGIDVNCEAVEDRQPSESLEVTDLSLTVDLSRSIEETVDEIETTVAQRDPVRLEPTSTTLKTPALADSSEPAVSERQSSDAADSDAETPRPGTATRLPGISETDLPRIRQRMYRIDI